MEIVYICMDALKKTFWQEEWNMIRPVLTLRRKRILVDLGTQRDLFTADGKCCIRNHRRVLANIRRVMAWARKDHIRIISTVQICNGHNGSAFQAGTDGVKKIRYTLRDRFVEYPSDGYTDFPRNVFDQHSQIILQLRSEDPFEEPRAERILSEIKATDFLIIGGPIETSVKTTVLGLLVRKRNVTLLTDALGYLEKNASEIALRQMQAKGAKLIDSKSMFGASHLHLVGACNCDRCQGRMQKIGIVGEL